MAIHHHLSRFWTAVVVPVAIGVMGSLIATWAAQRVQQKQQVSRLEESLKQEVLGNAHHLDAVVSETGRQAMAGIPREFLFPADFYDYARRDPWAYRQLPLHEIYDEVYLKFDELTEMMSKPVAPKVLSEVERQRVELHRIIRERLKLDLDPA